MGASDEAVFTWKRSISSLARRAMARRSSQKVGGPAASSPRRSKARKARFSATDMRGAQASRRGSSGMKRTFRARLCARIPV